MNTEKNVRKERIGRGVLGALLGALLGGAVLPAPAGGGKQKKS